MAAGDYVFAWEPLLDSLVEDPRLELLKGSRYDLTVSLFCREDHLNRRTLVAAFSDLLIAEWNYCAARPLFSWSRLLADKNFRESFILGSGVTRKSRGEHEDE